MELPRRTYSDGVHEYEIVQPDEHGFHVFYGNRRASVCVEASAFTPTKLVFYAHCRPFSSHMIAGHESDTLEDAVAKACELIQLSIQAGAIINDFMSSGPTAEA